MIRTVQRLAPTAGGLPRQLVVLLHGLGADGPDLLPLAEAWQPTLPQAEFLLPTAPFACDLSPFGWQWFSLRDWTVESMVAGCQQAAQLLSVFLDDALTARGLDDRSLALVGFSQGTMVALYTALRRARAAAALVGYAGMLPVLPDSADAIAARPPILLVHGDQDQVVPIRHLPETAEYLRGQQVPVEILVRQGLGHGIDAEAVAAGGLFLRQYLLGD